MKLLILSDLHLEFHKDGGNSFIETLNPIGVDVLILAGDITTCSSLKETLKHFCDRFHYVIYITGNHEYYGSSREEVHGALEHLTSTLPKFHWLDNDVVVINGQRFLGATLWFARAPHAPKHQMNDFYTIRDLEKWVYDSNRDAVNFLSQETEPKDVVITHHLPSQQSVSKRFEGNPLNAFFVCDVEHVMKERREL